MSLHRPGLSLVALTGLALSVAGCSNTVDQVDTLPRQPISGKVTLDGKPLATGKIQLDAAAAGQTPTPSVSAPIKDGAFTLDRAAGPVPGKYKVSISGKASVVIAADEIPGSAPKREPEPIPAKYNAKTTLTQEISLNPPPLDFALTSK